MTRAYDVVIVGAGPAGMACALKIERALPGTGILLLEMGRRRHRRPCPVDKGFACTGCGGVCNVISGIGGCIHRGDGAKLSKLPSGKRLKDIMGSVAAEQYCDQACQLIEDALGRPLSYSGQNFTSAGGAAYVGDGVRLADYPVAVLEEQEVDRWQQAWVEEIARACDLRTEASAKAVRSSGGGSLLEVEFWQDSELQYVSTQSVVLATGRAGFSWTRRQLENLKVPLTPPNFSIGARFEMSSKLLEVAGLQHPDLKAVSEPPGGCKSKTFCFCGGPNGGRIKFTNYQGSLEFPIITLDGHVTSSRPGQGRGLAGNFGVLTQVQSAAEFDLALGNFATQYWDLSRGRPVAQSLEDFVNGSPDCRSVPELLASLPFEPTVRDFQGGPLHTLFSTRQRDALIRGFATVMEGAGGSGAVEDYFGDILVVGPELEFLWHRPSSDKGGRVPELPLWVVGDAGGVAQGIVQATMFGLASADSVVAYLAGLG